MHSGKAIYRKGKNARVGGEAAQRVYLVAKSDGVKKNGSHASYAWRIIRSLDNQNYWLLSTSKVLFTSKCVCIVPPINIGQG